MVHLKFLESLPLSLQPRFTQQVVRILTNVSRHCSLWSLLQSCLRGSRSGPRLVGASSPQSSPTMFSRAGLAKTYHSTSLAHGSTSSFRCGTDQQPRCNILDSPDSANAGRTSTSYNSFVSHDGAYSSERCPLHDASFVRFGAVGDAVPLSLRPSSRESK